MHHKTAMNEMTMYTLRLRIHSHIGIRSSGSGGQQAKKGNETVALYSNIKSGNNTTVLLRSVFIIQLHTYPSVHIYFIKLNLYSGLFVRRTAMQSFIKVHQKVLIFCVRTLRFALQFVLFFRISCFSWGIFLPPFIIDFPQFFFSPASVFCFRTRSDQIEANGEKNVQLCLCVFQICPNNVFILFFAYSVRLLRLRREKFKWKHR